MKNILPILLFFSLVQLNAQTCDTSQLKLAFVELKNENSTENQRHFFNYFPNCFDELNSVFGYNKTLTTPLYSQGFEYIETYFSLQKIPIEDRMTKSIQIAIGGHWDADAINYFQNGLRILVFQNTITAYDVLKSDSKENIISFFYFFFHSIHPRYKSIPDKFDIIKEQDPEFYDLIKIGHKNAIHDSGH